MRKAVIITIGGFTLVDVTVNTDEKTAYAKECSDEGIFIGFSGHGVLSEKGELTAITNDITTNYLEVAMVKAMQHLGLKANDVQPSPINRKFEIIDVREAENDNSIHA